WWAPEKTDPLPPSAAGGPSDTLHQFCHYLPEIVFTRLCAFLRKSGERVVRHVEKRQEIGLHFIDVNQTRQEFVRFLALAEVIQGFRFIGRVISLEIGRAHV